MIGRQKGMIHLRVLFWLANLLLLRMGLTVAQSCNPQSQSCQLCTTQSCSGFHIERVLGHRNSSVRLICPYRIGGNPPVEEVKWFRQAHSGSQRFEIQKGTSRYGGSGLNELHISHVVPEDEGYYTCDVTRSGVASATVHVVGCVFVLGTAVFASCNAKICPREEVTVRAGDSIIFDTRITFINSGSCGIPQTTSFLKLYKGDNLLYSCNSNPCNEASEDRSIQAVGSGNHRFNMNLTKAGAVMENGGEYQVRVEIMNPRGNLITETLMKVFHVTVEGTVMTTPPLTSTVITGFPTIGSTQPSSTADSVTRATGTDMPIDPTMTNSVSEATPSSATTTASVAATAALKSPANTVEIIAPVISVVALIAICVAVVIIVVFRRKSRCICSCSDFEAVKPFSDCGHIPKSFIYNKSNQAPDSIFETGLGDVSKQRPESTFEKNLDFELEDEIPVEDQDGCPKRNSESSDI